MIKKIEVNEYYMKLVKDAALEAEIGGTSNIREEERMSYLSIDSLVGQLATYALHVYMFGDARKWRDDRWHMNRNPHMGDGGHDVTALNVDVKGSLIRIKLNINDYHLVVRPKEFHADWVYVLALVELVDDKSTANVYLMGWASSSMFPTETEKTGIFSGAYVLPVSQLKDLPPLVWDWS